MKVLQVSPYFHPHVGGVESHVLDLSKELASRGHEVTVLTTNMGKMPERETMLGFDIVRVKPLSIILKTPIVPRVRGHVRATHADVVHSHSPPPLSSYYTVRGCKNSNVPHVITYHADVEIPSRIGKLVAGFYRRTYGSYTVKRVDKIIVTSGSYHATSRSVWRYSPEIIPNTVDADRFDPKNDGSAIRDKHGIASDEPTVLFVGRIVWHKGIEYILEASTIMKETKFLVVGSGENLKKYKAKAKAMGVGDRVIFTGRLSWADLPLYYAACDVFTLPSISRLEAFGIATLEAMSTGKPVVVADIPGVREVIEDGEQGLIFDVMDAEDLASKLTRLLKDPELRKRMGDAGRKKVEERFLISKVADQVERVYENLTNR